MDKGYWTVPNLLSILRLVGVPIYFFLISEERYALAVLLLFLAGATDYFDGKIARRFNQASRLGELLDPAADRLYIVAVLYSLWQLDLVPIALLVTILARDIVIGILLVIMKRSGIPPFKVTYLGKAATFNLLYAFPFLLLTLGDESFVTQLSFVLGWAFSSWGVALYLYTGLSYLLEGLRLLRNQNQRAQIESLGS